MPTQRRRDQVTASDEIAAALKRAAERWPADAKRPSRLLLRLVSAGSEAIDSWRERRGARHRRAVERHHGELTGAYAAGCLEELRRGWPGSLSWTPVS
ncbi:MAG TPA: hypothetical protein VKU89_09725 [Solirubrobacteraceae bacterium]|nr:hypothetical protein [Solirubrobacteraceae bacterium]